MKFVALCTTVVLMLFAQAGFAQDKPFKEGSIWSVTFVKVKPGLFDTYLRDLSVNRKKLMEQAKKDGLILSEKMLAGDSAGREDFDLIISALAPYKRSIRMRSSKLFPARFPAALPNVALLCCRW